MADDLFTVRNYFILGNYQQCINEAEGLSGLSDALRIEKDALVYRSYVAQGKYDIVIAEVDSNAAIPLQAIKLLATYLASEDNRVIALETVKAWLNDAGSAHNETLRTIAAIVYTYESEYEEALKCLSDKLSLEQMSLTTQLLLRMNRVDLAEKNVKEMSQVDDDATVTQLSSCWVNMQLGGDKLKEARLTFRDLGERYGHTLLTLNGEGLCYMAMGEYKEAESVLQEALAKNSSDQDTLANIIVAFTHLHKSPEVIKRYQNQLQAGAAHPWSLNLNEKLANFDTHAAKYAIA